MALSILSEMRRTLQQGLRHNAIGSCSQWAERYRVMPQGSWKFDRHPWLRAMHDDKAELIVGRKASQMGFTECFLNRTFYALDIEKVDCLYLLPAKTPDATDFTAARFNPALELSPHLQDLFSDTSNVGHKRAGAVNLYVRGMKSRSGLKSIPVGYIVFDELDEMPKDNVPLALERMSGQVTKKVGMISTPTLPNERIDGAYSSSSQFTYSFKSPFTDQFITLSFPDDIKICGDGYNDPDIAKSHYICPITKREITPDLKLAALQSGIWTANNPNGTGSGYWISHMYSNAITAPELAKGYFKALLDPYSETEFYCSKLGVPHIVRNARISDEHINECLGSHANGDKSGDFDFVTMGIDVGNTMHVTIVGWKLQGDANYDINNAALGKLLYFGRATHFSELDLLCNEYNVRYSVIDSQPETRLAREYCSSRFGYARMCRYSESGLLIRTSDLEPHVVNCERTQWLDTTFGRVKSKRIIFPRDLDFEFKEHLKASVRTYRKDRSGNPHGAYVNEDKADHYAHSLNYAEIALRLGATLSSGRNINV